MRRTALAVISALALMATPSLKAGQTDAWYSQQKEQLPLFRGDIGGSLDKCMRPAYHAIESTSDVIYDFLRNHVVKVVLPGNLSRGLAPSPDTDSYAAYRKALAAKEDRFASQLLESYPAGVAGQGYYTAQQMQDWQNWAGQQQASILIDSFRDSLMERHQLENFGQTSEKYARDTDHWSPGFAMMSGIVGGTFLYLNGIHSTAYIGHLGIGVDLRAAMLIQKAAASRDSFRRLGGVELSWRDNPIVVAANWGMDKGRLVGDQVGLNYRLRY